MDEFPADAAAVALAGAAAGDAMADPVEAAELFDIDVDQLAGVLALVADHRLGWFEGAPAVEPEALQNAADAGRRDAEFGGDLFAGPALLAKFANAGADRFGQRSIEPVRPRAAVRQAGHAFLAKAPEPFAHGPRADARSALDRAASGAHSCAGSSGSSEDRQSFSTFQLPRPEPDGQPMESSHLAHGRQHKIHGHGWARLGVTRLTRIVGRSDMIGRLRSCAACGVSA
jgi:hypothetical protein